MGGCRCSYQSCTYATNGKIHFFHYPVRDSHRCSKWIAKANRPEFHKLSVSQLKNKVVCEYHFVDSMFMNYKHDRLIHTAIPTVEDNSKDKSDSSSPNEPYSKQTDIEIEIQDPYNLLTDVSPTDREASTMTVNVSPITGFSFIPPHEKRSKNSAPYIELLTRQHNNHHLPKRPIGFSKSSINKKSATAELAAINNDNKIVLQQPTDHYNIEAKENGDVSLSNAIIITDLFKTPPKSIKTVDKSKDTVKDVEIPKRKLNLRKRVINDTLLSKDSPIVESEPPKKLPVKMNILSDNIVHEQRNIENESHPILFTENDVPSQVIDMSQSLPVNEPCSPVTIIHQQLMQYSKQKSAQMNNISRKISGDKIDEPPSNCREEIVQKVERKRQDTLQKVAEPKIQENSLNNDYMKLIHQNSKEISELKEILLGQQAGKKYSSFKSRTVQKSFRPRRLSKAGLYAQIVPFLSPELARMVHSEMFPSTLRYKM